MDSYNIFFILSLTFIIGAAVGSFVTMASYRMPLQQDIVFKPSYCPSCRHALGIKDLFPVLSWVTQWGKCRYCKTPVHWRYPLIECLLGTVFTLMVFYYDISVDTGLLLLLITFLAIMIVTDLEHYIIPDTVQIGVFCTGMAWRIYNSNDLSESIAPVAVGLSIGLILHFGYIHLRKIDALGLGDVKFLAVAGTWISVTQFVPFLFVAGVIGTISGLLWRVAGKGEVFPFGPALAISLFINILFPDILQILQRSLI